MPSLYHAKEVLLIFQSPLFLGPTIAAFLILAALYAARSNANSSIPLYVPAKSAAGNQKKRWMYDSASLLQEAYKKVWDK